MSQDVASSWDTYIDLLLLVDHRHCASRTGSPAHPRCSCLSSLVGRWWNATGASSISAWSTNLFRSSDKRLSIAARIWRGRRRWWRWWWRLLLKLRAACVTGSCHIIHSSCTVTDLEHEENVTNNYVTSLSRYST